MILLKNGKILENSKLIKKDILIANGKIKKISDNIEEKCSETYDLKGKFVTEGLIDIHVHFREPGYSYKETIKSGSRSAAKGGFTTVMTMPNLSPIPDTYENLKKQLDIIKKDSVIRVIPYGAITKGEKGEDLADFKDLNKEVFAFSDDGRGVQDANMMYEAMLEVAKLKKAVVAHCEDNSLKRGGWMNEGKKAKELDQKGIPNICETVQIARDILLAEASGCHYHVCHVSTKEAIRMIRRAKKDGIKISCEVSPHHLLSDEESIDTVDGKWKMNPPLRAKKDRQALIEGVLDGTIDVIATDHAPHAEEEKTLSMEKSAFGIVGSETAFSTLYTDFVKTKIFTLEKLVDMFTKNVRKTFNLPYSKLKEGEPADIAVINLERKEKIDPEKFLSKGKNTPYAGKEVYGIVELTISNGKIAYIDETIK